LYSWHFGRCAAILDTALERHHRYGARNGASLWHHFRAIKMSTVALIRPSTVPNPSRTADRHYPQLDGLRCLGVLLVIWQHAYGASWHGWGNDGVRLFFVLSAFLISGIVLRLRDGHVPLGRALRTFYARRILRLVPAYYAFLALLALAHFPSMGENWPYHVLYLSNWRTLDGDARRSFLGHLWTLSIEEQFYVVWPTVIFLISSRRLPWAIAGTVAASMLLRLAFAVAGAHNITYYSTTSSFDALGLGALLAWHVNAYPTADRRRWLRASLGVGIAFYVASWASYQSGGQTALQVSFDCWGASFAGVWLVGRAVEGFTGRPAWLLTAWPMRSVGRVSYVVYLVQGPVLAILLASRGGFGLRTFLATLTISVAIASASWRWLEAPINAQKRRFPYPAIPGNAGSVRAQWTQR
jgi:peptidoglycan/LPS O-acetylase OafA/YrhL